MKIVSAIAAVALLASFVTLDAPGITIDESLNVGPGVLMMKAEAAYGLAAIDPRSQIDIFTEIGLPTDYPPLGRGLLGLTHEIAALFIDSDVIRPDHLTDIYLARAASAVAFSLTVLLVGWTADRWYGGIAGPAAAIAVLLSPRLFGHAHLASIETILNLTFTLCVVLSADRMSGQTPPGWKVAAIGGSLWGLVLLTKIQAVLIPIPLTVWMFAQYRTRAVAPLAVYAGVGLAVFLIGWPWLWTDPIGRSLAYFGQGTDRIVLHAYYFGRVVEDHVVPWHYPFVLFLLTQPGTTLLLGGIGLRARLRHRPTQLVAATMLFALLFFALPGIVVYDGPRLFLIAYPLAAILAGAGAAAVWTRFAATKRRLMQSLASIAIAGPVLHLVLLSPCWLSYYNIGARPAVAIGMEANYWGDAVTPSLLDDASRRAGRRGTVLVTPSLHPIQLTEQSEYVPRGVMLAAYGEGTDGDVLIVFARYANLEPEGVPAQLLANPKTSVDGWTVVRRLTREGATLALLAVRD